MTQEEFRKLKVGQIKELLDGSVEFDYLLWAQEDSRSSVRKLAQAYVMRQKKVLLEKQRIDNLYTYENSFYEEGLYHVAGVDEVGRGPIAGPVTVAAVILPPNLFLSGLNDSKKLSPQKRDSLYDQIMAEAVLVDAMPLPDLTVPVESLIKGDSKSASIAAASIIAKVTRDRYMESLEDEYPGYGFAVHKGYFTPLHREALENQGVTPLHRKSFEPIKTMVGFK